MENVEKLISANCVTTEKVRVDIKKGQIVIRIDQEKFDGFVIGKTLKIADYIVNIKKYPHIPIVFDFIAKELNFADKMVYILFECICYYLIKSGYRVLISMDPKPYIHTKGCETSPLNLLRTGKYSHIKKFEKKFENDIYGKHFRRVISNKDRDSKELSILMDEIASFQKFFDIKEDNREKVTEVLVELVGNALEHSEGDCLIDLDIAENYVKAGGENGKKYLGINIAIVNFSEELLGTALTEKIVDSEDRLPERYEKVKDAYQAHKKYFSEEYLGEDFFNIATFQHKISGRAENVTTGGTGLTKLIKSLEEESDAYECYVISGRRILLFKHEYMKYNDDGWIGFNEENDFLEMPPSLAILDSTPIFFPGTGYNLTFVMEVMEND